MANLPALSHDGQSTIFFKASGLGTDLNPFVVRHALADGDGNEFSSLLLGSNLVLTVALVDDQGNQILNFGGDASAANQVDILNSLDAIETALAGTLSVDTGLTPLTDVQLRASPVPVSGTFWQTTQPVSLSSVPLATDAATATNQSTIIEHIDGIEGLLAGTLSVDTGLSPLTDTQLRATPVPVSGIVTANTGLTQPLTDTQLRATPVPVSGTFWQATQPVSLSSLPSLPTGANVIGSIANTSFAATQSGSWSVSVSNLPATQPISATSLPLPTGAATAANQATIIGHIDGIEAALAGTLTVNTGLTPLTDTQLRAAPVPVSGTVTANTGLSQPLTDTQLRASAVPVSLDISTLATATNQSTANTRLGDVTETAPGTDTASSGLNGRLQRIAQRLTSLIALFPSSLGAKTAANSLAVTLAPDGVASGIATQIGEVQASPTANTVLDRLKAIVTALGAITLASESGFSTYRNTALTNTAVAVKASAGSVMGWNFINVNTVPVYVKFYNIASGSVTVGTSAVSLTITVPPGDGTTPGMFFLEPGLIPIEVFSTAISMACVTGVADNSNSAPSTAIHASVRYK